MATLPITPSDVPYARFSTQPVSPQFASMEQANVGVFNLVLNIVSLVVLLSFILSILRHRKKTHQHYTLQQQREMLERIWQLSSTK
jgi:uncharacterized membrane protein